MIMTNLRPIVDLHVHSNKSDGSLSPSDLVSLAVKKSLTAFALTDHDTVDGIDEAIAVSKVYQEKGIDISVIPGIELSTEYQGKDIHIVGLFIDKEQPAFKERINFFVEQRMLRNEKMCKKLSEHGIEITFTDLVQEYPDSVITRAHYARYMLGHGFVSSMKEAFERYIGDHAPCFVPREKISPADAVELILSAKGIPVLAHPLLYGFGKEALQNLIHELKEVGLVAMETIYCTHTPADQAKMTMLAEENGLLISGGSDFHGAAKPGLELATGYGKLYIPLSVLEELKKKHTDMLLRKN